MMKLKWVDPEFFRGGILPWEGRPGTEWRISCFILKIKAKNWNESCLNIPPRNIAEPLSGRGTVNWKKRSCWSRSIILRRWGWAVSICTSAPVWPVPIWMRSLWDIFGSALSGPKKRGCWHGFMMRIAGPPALPVVWLPRIPGML